MNDTAKPKVNHHWFPESPPEALWLAAALLAPAAYNPWGSNIFALPKAVLVRALALLLALAAAWPAPRKHRIPAPVWGAVALGGVWIAATLLSTNVRASVWGSYERQQGLLTQLSYLTLFGVAATRLETPAAIRRLQQALVWGSAPVVVYGLVQAAGLDPCAWQSDAASPVLSTVGRANFLGSYLVLALPLTAVWALRCPKKAGAILLFVAQAAVLALTRARAAWVGLAAGCMTGVVVGAFAVRRVKLAWIIASMTTAVCFAGLILLLTGVIALPDGGSVAARLTIWRATLPLVTARPWFGYGPDTFPIVFAGVFPPELVYYQGRHVLTDRAHTLWLDLGMSAGLAGVLAFLAVLATWGRTIIRSHSDTLTRAGLAAAVMGHLVDLQFSFSVTTTAVTFWLALALGIAHERVARQERPVETPAPALHWERLLPLVAGLALVWVAGARPLLADMAFFRAQQNDVPFANRAAAARRAVALWPQEPAYRLGLATVQAIEGDWAGMETSLDAATALAPNNARLWAARGELYAVLGTDNPAYLLKAEVAYRQAVALAPTIATYHTGLGLLLAQQEQWRAARAELERAVDLDTTDFTAYGYLAEVYTVLDETEKAEWAGEQAQFWRERTR
ncbi:MAG: O-antigen ligase family protein [Anaerolineae bacterium]|nr:O-antigen ligase family protein [Anaerolineae bacterium]